MKLESVKVINAVRINGTNTNIVNASTAKAIEFKDGIVTAVPKDGKAPISFGLANVAYMVHAEEKAKKTA